MNFLDPVDSAMEIIRNFMSDVASDFITSGMKYMSEYVANPTNFNKIPHFDELMIGTQAIGSSVAVVFFYLRLLNAYKDLVTEESDVNYSEIIGNFVITLVMVWSFKPFLTKFIFPITNELIEWIGAFNVDVNAAGQVVDKISPSAGLATASLHILFVVLVFGIGCLVFSIASMIRFAHLVIAMIAGPIFMATYANKSGVFKSFLMSLTAVIFTQVIHMLSFALIVWTASVGTFEMLMLSLAFIIVGICGPHVIKQWLFSSGIGGASAGIGRMAMMRFSFKR
ncbi:hypothetical protein CN514_07630 [Bacillus sp. AFS001701]|uniref:conjugal transfer protein TrbL family protein n=1 Tax=Bacillus sp. AFS001701 TaxID=2033480 RepID=UPI000BF2578E|nr:hypothetical protein [Bacillus sp. AFS001701]PET71259.1 hypothetical protein CN514_07630 [Bacillus sp. AFS001701]